MEFSSMRPFLQGLCYDAPWNYAVFWKLKHEYEMILVWEDGFHDVSKSRKPMVGPVDAFYLENSNKVASHIILPVLDGTLGEYPIELALTEMLSASHLVGEGFVGRAALAGNAHWIYPDNMSTDAFDSFLDSEYLDEWLLQVAAGIKTVLLLPVNSYGVLQLGSVEMVPEDTTLVAHVLDQFEAHQNSAGCDPEYSIQQFNLGPGFMENFEESLTSDGEKVIELQKGTQANKTDECMVPFFRVQNLYNSSVSEFTNTPENVIDSQFSWQSLDMFHSAETCHLSSENDFTITNTILKSLHLDETISPFPYIDNSGEALHGDFVNELMGFSCDGNTFEQIFSVDDFNSTMCEDESNLFSLVTESDLHKALKSAIAGDTSLYAYASSINQNSTCNLIHDKELLYGEDISGFESAGFPLKEDEVKHPVEAVVANSLASNFDGNSSEHSSLTSISVTSKGHLSSCKRTSQPNCSASPEEDKSPWSFLTSAFVAPEKQNASNMFSQVSPVASKIGTSRQQKRKGDDSLNLEKVSRLSTTSKGRVSSGDNKKPKPRDRQLIQDRIKELRDLIPNSEKCSIDGLLDKTINHMHFLRTVTDQADKLRLQNLKEETDENMTKAAEATRGHQKGTSWAIEVGPDQQSCPIIVKDLDHPGHMVIEMLCANHDRFLEIADVIHRLQLTILKGLMEEKPDNSWARFIVQASGNFHRLDIFWPLMQLM